MIVEEEFNNKNQLNKILKKVNTIQGKAIIDTQNKTVPNLVQQLQEDICQMMDLHKNS